MGLRPSGLDSTHPIAICMLGSPEAKSREVAISDVLLPDCRPTTNKPEGCAYNSAARISRIRPCDRNQHLQNHAPGGDPNQVVSASASPFWVGSPTQATYPSGRTKTAVGAVTAPIAGSSHVPLYLALIN
jgi:hypothetical protein